jgi:malonyl CoA-acyl carrier protein transacylase
VPVVAWGAAGLDSSAGLRLLGASGVVLSDQLMLASDAPTSDALRKVLATFNPADTVQLGRSLGARYRVYGQLGTKPPRQLNKLEASGTVQSLFWAEVAARSAKDAAAPNLKEELLPLGQDAALAVTLGRLGSTADIIEAVNKSTHTILHELTLDFPLAAGAGISSVNGTGLPVHQGPMAQTSDTPAFAAAVVKAGAMPWLALGNMPPHIAEETIRRTKELLGDEPFGAGIIGLDANPFRDDHIEIIARLQPAYCLVAAGTAEQALTVENKGVPAYLHTPTPGLLRGALQSGCRRFILEGSEAGGHVGQLGGLLLWQLGVLAMMDAFEAGVDPTECAFVPAGGVGDAPSSAAAAATMYRLHRLGVSCGIQMGTAYLLTTDIVESGALSQGFQRCALDVRRTVLMGETVRTPTRVLCTAEAGRVLDRETERESGGVALRTRKEEYEHDNLGGLRAAAKAQRIASIDPEKGAIFEQLTAAEQEDQGLFHAGQIVAVTDGTQTIESLHASVVEAAQRVEVAPAISQTIVASSSVQEELKDISEVKKTRVGVAIIGVGAVLPGAENVEAFWSNLLAGRSAIGEIPEDRWDADLYFSEDRSAPDKTYSRIGGFVRGFEFDRKSFRLPPTVANQMDLTQKLALTATRAALADAGYLDKDFDRSNTAVIVGAARGDSDSLSDVRSYYPLFHKSARKVLGSHLNGELETVLKSIEEDFKGDLKPLTEDTMPGELDNIIAGRIAAIFDLRGPNFTTDAACASSMAAIEVAFRGLQDGRFDMAVTGGVDCMMAPPAYIKFSKIGALSARHSAPFDIEADGFVMGEGAAILLLKREEDAVRDGDRIYAVIRGIGGSSDGKGKGITAPNPAGQQLAITRALKDAQVTPASIGMVEAHGTGTRVGDRVEVGVLREFYQRGQIEHDIALGSVKSNLGHLKGASGAVAVLKAALAIHHGTIPATLNVQNVNPDFALEQTPFYLPTGPTAWPENAPRRAAVSSFGFGGTNFHVILDAPGTDRAVAPRAKVVVQAAEPVMAAATAAPTGDGVGPYPTILAILCERTGYDADEIESDFELEADLGIDTVKQAEIMASVREHYSLARDEDFRLAEYPTLGHLAGYVVERMGMTAPSSASDEVLETAAAPIANEAAVSGVSYGMAYEKILVILCERTGYDADEIEADFELEADLGIDTVKQAEIMASVREHYSLARDEDFRLAEYPTLGHLASYVVARTAGTSTPVREIEVVVGEASASLGVYLPIILSAPDTATLASRARALAAAGASEIEAARAARGSVVSPSDTVRLSIAAEDIESARALLEKAASCVESGKGLRPLENRGVYVRQIAQCDGKIAFLFPGQGSQYAGMLADLREDFPVVEATFQEADAALADLFPQPLSEYMNPGGVLGASADRKSAEDALRQTQITQPAMVAADVAILRLLGEFGVVPDIVGGHSLGEYSAAVAADIMDFATGLRTVAARGDAMANANPGDAGLMAAITASAEVVQAVLDTVDGYVVCANKNCHTQTVIAGSTAGVEDALERLQGQGIDGMLIPVSHAFHSKIVSGACEPLGAHLASQDIRSPKIPIITNVTADYYPSVPQEIRDILTVQLASPVEFVKMVERMHDDGVRVFVEVGPKRALTGFVGSILEGRTHRAYLSNHPKKGGRQTMRELLAALGAEGLLFHEQPARVTSAASETSATALADSAKGEREISRDSTEPHIVISGMAVGLPGMDRVFGDEDPFDAILSGQNLIGTISDEVKDKVLAKNIQRLKKGPAGGGEFVTVEKRSEVPQLAGMLGEFDLTEDFGISAELVGAMDQASRLALGVSLDALRDAGLPLAPAYRVTRNGSKVRTGFRLPDHVGGRMGVIFASAFTGFDRLIEDVRAATLAEVGAGEFEFDRKFLLKVLGMGNAQVAEYVGARGPNTRINSACASTTFALSMAEDWIRLGRADKVLVVGADDVTSDGMIEWFSAGFVAAGAASTEADVTKAALPFDKRRAGMIMGAGAVALVVERNEDVVARGMEPIADLLGTRVANSAFHPTRLDVGHIAAEVEAFISDAEAKHGLDRTTMASSTMFMSHETYTPARGGSAAAEIAALRSGFGEAANEVVIANTKGFSGHAMAAGIEDAIALKALQRGQVPPIANFKEPDPELGDLRLSDGSPVDVKYALRLAAGFGSQLGLALFGRRAQTENRVVDEAAWAAWLARCADAPAGKVEVVKRNLRVLPAEAPPPRPVPEEIVRTDSRAGSNGGSPQAPVVVPSLEPGTPGLGASADDIYKVVLQVLCDRTGYDADEVEPEFELEADLGIDTVKQAEIMASVREIYGLGRDEDFRLAEYPTLARLCEYVVARAGGNSPAVVPADISPASLKPTATVNTWTPRQVVAVPVGPLFADKAVLGSLRDLRVLLIGDGAVAEGIKVVLDSHGATRVEGDDFDALINVQTEAVDPEAAGFSTFQLARGFKTAEAKGFFLTVTSAGGQFGFDGADGAVCAAAAAGVTRSLARELPAQRVKTIDLHSTEGDELATQILIEALGGDPETDVGFVGGQRIAVRELAAPKNDRAGIALDAETVVLLTGGASGITAQVAQDIATRYGCKLALVGRTSLTHDNPLEIDLVAEKARAKAEIKARGERVTPVSVQKAVRPLARQLAIAETVQDLRRTGAQVEYFSADLSDAEAVGVAVAKIRERFGRVDVVIHGAGVEISRLAEQKSDEEFRTVFCGKALGALTLWKLLGEGLRAFVGFSSVAGRYGNVGQTDYAAANGLLGRLVQRIDATSDAVGLCIDWTAWDDVGMATHGSMRDILIGRGVELLPCKIGAPMVADMLIGGVHGEVVVAGLLGDLAPSSAIVGAAEEVFSGGPDLSSFPMLDTVREYTKGKKVVAHRRLSLEVDHFLRGHIYDGQVLVPGVMGVELMTEAARLLHPELELVGIESVEFLKALKLHRGEPADVTIVAEAGKTPGEVVCRVETRRTAKTGRTIEVLHYRAVVMLAERVERAPMPLTISPDQTLTVGPDRDAIYERMFHTEVFEVLERVPFVGERAVIAHGRQPAGKLSDRGANAHFAAAPFVIEMGLQAAGLWGMVHQAYSYLPVEIGRVQYQGEHRQGDAVVLRVAIREGSAEHVIADVEARSEDGSFVLVLTGVKLIGHRAASEAERFAPSEPVQTVVHRMTEAEATALLSRLGVEPDSILSPEEEASRSRIRSALHRREWFTARVLAKNVVRQYMLDFFGVKLGLADIEIAHRESGEPYVHVRSSVFQTGWDLAVPPISVTHSSGLAGVAVSITGPRVRPGVDFEKVEERSAIFVRDNFHESELAVVIPGAQTEGAKVTALWAVKEAITKALGQGLRLSTLEIAVQTVDSAGVAAVTLTGQAQKVLADLGGSKLEARVWVDGEFAIAEAALTCAGVPAPVRSGAGLPEESIAAVAALLFHTGLLKTGSPS